MGTDVSRIAVLADVHGNVPALEAVLDDIARTGADRVVVGGDLVGRGPEGRAVVERIRSLGLLSVRGNHEDLLLATRDTPRGKDADDDIARCTRWMADDLDDAAAAFAAALPPALVVPGAPDVRIVHGSPRSNREGIGPWTSAERVRELFDDVPEPVLCCAHTHRPLVHRLAGGLVVNVGSVGLPFDGDPRAAYALLVRDRDGWHSEVRRVPYDRDRVLARYRTTGFLDECGAMAAMAAREIETARSHLVPFEAWCRERGLPPVHRLVADFLEGFVPEQPVA